MDDGSIAHQGTPAQLNKELNKLMVSNDKEKSEKG
jgi:hypothetical protein